MFSSIPVAASEPPWLQKGRQGMNQSLGGVTGSLPLMVAHDHRHRCVRDGACLDQLGWLIYTAKRHGRIIHRPQKRTDRSD
jgi:hypothetical protein